MNRRIVTLGRGIARGAILLLLLPAAASAAQEESRLSVTDYGVGTGVADRQLQGQGDRFLDGSSIVFWTRVVGGEDGERIRHVWIRDGEEVLSVGLTLGGPHWRTHSRKTLHEGSTGDWTVEARDAEDRVLATASFKCVSRDSDEPGADTDE
jgi:hypothetical protein